MVNFETEQWIIKENQLSGGSGTSYHFHSWILGWHGDGWPCIELPEIRGLVGILVGSRGGSITWGPSQAEGAEPAPGVAGACGTCNTGAMAVDGQL